MHSALSLVIRLYSVQRIRWEGLSRFPYRGVEYIANRRAEPLMRFRLLLLDFKYITPQQFLTTPPL